MNARRIYPVLTFGFPQTTGHAEFGWTPDILSGILPHIDH
jgi:hypothetical protein